MGVTTWRAARVWRHGAVVVACLALLGCASTTSTPPARPGTTEAITPVGDDFLEMAGEDIFGDVAAGGGSVWVATLEGLIQVDPATMDATWHSNLAPGRKIVYAFDSLWIGGPRGIVRLDPTSLEEIARVRIAEPEGIAADGESLWTSQHGSKVVARIDPSTNKVVETIDVASTDYPLGAPMGPAVVDGEVWVSMGNGSEVVRIDAERTVSRIDLEKEMLTPGVATPDAIWFSNWQDRRVAKIDRATGVVTSAEVPESALARPGGIGPGILVDDTLWFPTSGGTMVAIDPLTFGVIGSVAVQGSMPRKAVVYDDAVWLANEFDGSLERIPLGRLAEGLASGG